MKNKLIADAGSSKIDWVLLGQSGEVINRVTSNGMNALMSEIDDLAAAFNDVSAQLSISGTLQEIHYYGAGCANAGVCTKIQNALNMVWKSCYTNVYSDLLGAARGCLGKSTGIIGILGTGSNSGLYDGRNLIQNIPSLGFILGDEGSGAALGKRLVSDAFKGHLPMQMRDQFVKTYGMSLSDILDRTYRQPAPNRFLASLAPFLSERLWNPYIYSLVLEEISEYFRKNIAMYPGARSLPLAFCGSIAWNFADVLRDAASRQGFTIASISSSPMPGLIDFHKSTNI